MNGAESAAGIARTSVTIPTPFAPSASYAYTASATLYAHSPITDPSPASWIRRRFGLPKLPRKAPADSPRRALKPLI